MILSLFLFLSLFLGLYVYVYIEKDIETFGHVFLDLLSIYMCVCVFLHYISEVCYTLYDRGSLRIIVFIS